MLLIALYLFWHIDITEKIKTDLFVNSEIEGLLRE